MSVIDASSLSQSLYPNWVQPDILQRVSLVRPGGNDTAIVWDVVPRSAQGSLALRIQDAYPDIEQVMFAERTPTGWRGQMAGGEFCGNATRSLGYMLLDGKDGQVDLEVSGAAELMDVRVLAGHAVTQVPVRAELDCVSIVPEGGKIVRLSGIAFLVAESTLPAMRAVLAADNVQKSKSLARQILSAHDLLQDPACGLIIVHEGEAQLRIDPFVHVRDTQTLYYESGCGSGSTAVGVALAHASGQSVEQLALIQPSGMPLIVSVQRNEQAFLRAEVSGPIAVLHDGSLALPVSLNAAANREILHATP